MIGGYGYQFGIIHLLIHQENGLSFHQDGRKRGKAEGFQTAEPYRKVRTRAEGARQIGNFKYGF